MRVLVVDDNEINLEIQQMMLESCGLDVDTAESGKDAVELAKTHDFSIIFMDINMPEMDGYTACKLIRETDKDVSVIALSADNPEDDSRFAESGMNGYLMKPLQIDDLKKLLKNYMDIQAETRIADAENVIFDYDGLMSVIKDEKAVQRLLNQFISVHNRDCELLNERVQAGNFLEAREIMHNIRGISGNMFCHRLYKLSCELNSELRQEHFESLDEFTKIWNITVRTLEEYHNKLEKKYPAKENKTDWNTLWNSFISLCYEFDISAVDIFTEHIQSFIANMSAEKFKQLKKAVLNYDFLWISDNM
ncbi:MAG: response regulator [Ruminococcus sp.]|nr:response regulator [Ruminococcus sp.]